MGPGNYPVPIYIYIYIKYISVWTKFVNIGRTKEVLPKLSQNPPPDSPMSEWRWARPSLWAPQCLDLPSANGCGFSQPQNMKRTWKTGRSVVFSLKRSRLRLSLFINFPRGKFEVSFRVVVQHLVDVKIAVETFLEDMPKMRQRCKRGKQTTKLHRNISWFPLEQFLIFLNFLPGISLKSRLPVKVVGT